MRYNDSNEAENKKLANFNLAPERMLDRIDRLFGEMSKVFEEVFNNMSGLEELDDFHITENGENVVVSAKIPRLSEDNLDVRIFEDYISLSGKQQSSNEYRSLDNNSYRSQKSYSAFFRTIPLPVRVDSHGAKVEYTNGELCITVPRL